MVDWEFHTIDGREIARVSVEPSDHPVFERKGGSEVFWVRNRVGTAAVEDDTERQHIYARRWGR